MLGIRILPDGKRKRELDAAIREVLAVFATRILPFDLAAARHFSELAAKARATGQGFPVPDAYIAAIAAANGFAVATRDASAFTAAGLRVIDPWTAPA